MKFTYPKYDKFPKKSKFRLVDANGWSVGTAHIGEFNWFDWKSEVRSGWPSPDPKMDIIYYCWVLDLKLKCMAY